MFEISPTIIWAIIGLVLIVIEVFTTTFFLLFFGVAALLVTLIKLFGLDYLPAEIIIFAVLGIAGTFLFRSRILKSFQSAKAISIDKEKPLTLTADIPAGKTGNVTYQGTTWQALNATDTDFKAGDNVIIEKTEGIKLILTK